MSEELDAAIALVRAGHGEEAEKLIAEAMRADEASWGSESAAYAARLFELATVRMASGDLANAAPPLRRAVELRLAGRDAEKARLTYAMNLGELHQALGELDLAEEVLRTSLGERARFYGEAHAGYAYGLESLASLLRSRGALAEARGHIEKAVAIFRQEENPRLAGALATRAPIVKALGEAAFTGVDALPGDAFDELAQTVLAQERFVEPPLQLAVLEELRGAVEARGETRANLLQAVVSAVARVARVAKAHDVRRQAIRWLLARLEERAEVENVVSGWQSLALAEAEAGDSAAAERAYTTALGWAERAGNRALKSQVLRNYGLFLAEEGEDEARGRDAIGTAVRLADEAGAFEAAARARIALGIRLQHDGELAVARTLLEAALPALPPSDPDALTGSSHLHAIADGQSCGCGDMRLAIGEALWAMVEPLVPQGLVEALRVGDGGKLEVQLAREPTDAEGEALDRALRHAMATLRAEANKPR